MKSETPMKIAFVTHEYGLMRNGGGVGGYLYYFSKMLLEYSTDIEIYVLTCTYHKRSDLADENRIHIFKLNGKKLSENGKLVREILKKVQPDFVEVSDYLGLCLESMVYKHIVGKNLNDTVFLQYCHTATKEIYEWGGFGNVLDAKPRVKVPISREWSQTVLADVVMAPSSFLQNYVEEHYGIKKPERIPYAMDVEPVDRAELLKSMNDCYDLEEYNNTFVVNYITRFEGRKNQPLLVRAFIRFLEMKDSKALLILAGNSMENLKTGKNLMLEIYEEIPEKFRKNILFFEFATLEEKKKIYAVSDLTVMASPYENFPLSMIESVRYGVPIMTSVNCGGFDYMGDYQNAMTFDAFNEGDLLKKMINFRNLDRAERDVILKEEQRELVKLCSKENAMLRKFSLFQEERGRKEKKTAYRIMKAGEDDTGEIDDENILFVKDGNLTSRRKKAIDAIICRIAKHPGSFCISLGDDTLHTDCNMAWEADYPVLFTHVQSGQTTEKELFQRLKQEREKEFFSIPMKVR